MSEQYLTKWSKNLLSYVLMIYFKTHYRPSQPLSEGAVLKSQMSVKLKSIT